MIEHIVRAVDSACDNNDQCGNGICKGKRCQCGENQYVEQTVDVLGRPIGRCVNNLNTNGKISFRIYFFLVKLFIFRCWPKQFHSGFIIIHHIGSCISCVTFIYSENLKECIFKYDEYLTTNKYSETTNSIWTFY